MNEGGDARASALSCVDFYVNDFAMIKRCPQGQRELPPLLKILLCLIMANIYDYIDVATK